MCMKVCFPYVMDSYMWTTLKSMIRKKEKNNNSANNNVAEIIFGQFRQRKLL